jgi:hypothetical protein
MITRHNAIKRYDLLIPTVLGILTIISVYLVLISISERIAAVPTTTPKQISNNTSAKKIPTRSSNDNSTKPCTNSVGGFSIRYPSNWIDVSGNCSFFTPDINTLFVPSIQPFVRISVSILNLSSPTPTLGIGPSPMPSISEIESEVKFFADGNFFKRVSGPMAISTNAFVVLYDWTGDPESTLPYVNQFSLFPSTNTSRPFVIPSTLNSSQLPSPPNATFYSIRCPPNNSTPCVLPAMNLTNLTNSSKPPSPPNTSDNTNAKTNLTNSSKPPSPPNTSDNTNAKDPFIAKLMAIYFIRENRIYTIEYAAPVLTFGNRDNLNAVTNMLNSLTFTSPPPKPANCNQPIFANTAACNPPPPKPANCNQPIFANTPACNPPPPPKPANCNQPIFVNSTRCS